MIAASSLVLLFYVPGLLGPLTESVDKLAALADTEGANNVAVVGLNNLDLQRSIELIEEQIDAFSTLRRARDRQGQRQARFIRQQMLQLASRLDEEARTGILADLERIELAGKSGESEPAGTALRGSQERDLRLEKIVDEVGILALGFQSLVSRVGDQYQQLDRLVAELREALRVKTQFIAIQQELEVARKMQQSILPRAFQSRDGLALEATMLAAKEIGGDFYDFFAVDAHRVAMAVADVSGKGVPAALFMAVSRTLLRAVAQFNESPAKCLARLNDLLAGDNEQMMFVTLFYAVLDTRDGSLVYANAGHNPPYLLRSSGAIEAIPSTGDMALAIMEGLDYGDGALVLAPGDGLFIYTDGVTEAFDPVREMFGQARLEALLAQFHALPVAELPNRIIAEVKAFEAGGPQTDDITCLLARYRSLV
jgi:serine phosphatase RsbU (regulator of sigma subunit)